MKKIKCFPNGATKCVTFSFDDGKINDIRLSELFNKYNMKCTFNLPDCFLKVKGEDFYRCYNGHEVACHGAEHKKLTEISNEEIVKEITVNKQNLESLVGYSVCGHAYAGGYHDDRSISVLKDCGIVYGRTTINSNDFSLPNDFMRWSPSCHQRNSLELAERLVNENDDDLKILYIWGHSYEFATEGDWVNFENVLKILANDGNIWYATNIEVYRFLNGIN